MAEAQGIRGMIDRQDVIKLTVWFNLLSGWRAPMPPQSGNFSPVTVDSVNSDKGHLTKAAEGARRPRKRLSVRISGIRMFSP